ncbi:hypothetical protein CRUP_025946 [Coryphaenoides rupestris]|nr:hypothetical protein CRUP_025946 [Coryphaenoides rupestris]
MTTHSRDRHSSCTQVNRCMRKAPGQVEVEVGGSDLGDVAEVRVVLGGHQQQQQAVGQLDAVQRHDAHVEEDPEEHGNPVTRCSLTSWMRGLSPGATALLMTVRALVCVTERTVAADSHGRPNMAEAPPTATMISRSRWKPVPLCLWSYAVIWDSMKTRMKTRRAGRALAAIIHTGNCPSEPSGEMNQSRFSGLSHLGVGVGDAPVHQYHDEDRDGDAKVSDNPP